MDVHTAKERRLKSDIVENNVLRRELEKRISKVRLWTEEIAGSKNHRRKKKLQQSVTRYQACVDDLKQELLLKDEDLEKRIKEEMAYSEDEIKVFQADLEKHVKELRKIEASLEAAKKEKHVPKAEEQAAVKKVHLRKLLKQEAKKIKLDEKELVSEERDEAIFTHELKRIALDRKLFGT